MALVNLEYFEGVFTSLANYLSSFSSSSLVVNVLLFAIILAVVSFFIWKFYKSTSKRNLIELDLRKYNYSEHPVSSKAFAIVLYLLEYVIIMPFLLVLWFTGLSLVLLLIAKERSVTDVLFISAALIGAIRILAYYKGEIAKDLAKLFPFITLSIFLLSPGAFDFSNLFSQLAVIPQLIDSIFSFVLIISLLEIVLRVFYTVFEFYKSEEENPNNPLPKVSGEK